MLTRPNLIRRVGQFATLFVMAVLGLIDLASSVSAGGVPLTFILLIGALATATVWLPPHRQNSTRLPKAAMLLAGFSLMLTIGVSTAYSGLGGSFGLAESVGLLAVMYVVCRRGEIRWTVGAVLLLGMAIGFMPLRAGVDADYIIVGLAMGLVATAVIALAVYLRIIESTRLRAMDSVRSEQRAEFARDLHDFIAHHVTGIVVQAQGARFIAEQDPKRVLLALEQIEAAGAETMASMRRMVGVLRDPNARPDAPLAPLAGVDELGPLLEQFSAAGDVLARLHVDGSTAGIAVEVSTSAYRVVMEALTNIRRHAKDARVADVWVRRTPDWLLVRVANDGAPPRAAMPREAPGYGLVGLTERVRAVGGRITAGPGIGGGWIVDAALPLDQGVTR